MYNTINIVFLKQYMPLALSQVRVDSLLGASCSECEVRVDQGESPGCELTCYRIIVCSTVDMAPGRYGPLSVYMAHQDGRYGPPLVDIAKTVIARLCYINYNIAIIVRRLEGPPPPAIWK